MNIIRSSGAAVLFLVSLVASSLAQTSRPIESEFASPIDLSPLRSLSIQHQDSLKTLDTFARQVVTQITGKATVDGRDSLETLLDMAMRPGVWHSRRVVKIRHVPIRQDLAAAWPGLSEADKQRLIREGTISLDEFDRPEVREALAKIAGTAAFKYKAVQEVGFAADSLHQLGGDHSSLGGVMKWRLIAPPPGSDATWKTPEELLGNSPSIRAWYQSQGSSVTPRVEGYDDAKAAAMIDASLNLAAAWASRDAAETNRHVRELAELLPSLSPSRYPSETKRHAEVLYNKFTKLTVPGAMLYFFAFAAFLVAARGGAKSVRITALSFMAVAFVVHTVGIGVRWWLVDNSTNDWFHSIPIKNQFESVLFSAWFGALVGLVLEIWKKKNLFGAAASFVGWLSLVAIFASPYVFGREIGGEISHVNGVLMSYWLYIHVTTVTASYALIGMSFLLGIWWLIAYYRSGGVTNRVGLDADDSTASDMRGFLATLDRSNLTVLQLAFWILGLGIVFGAIWADQSWGRPWGWDPKETFALVTWIVYLIVVHVRIVAKHKAWWTAGLSVVGFFVMLFNWIGVNFFRVGLHSYA